MICYDLPPLTPLLLDPYLESSDTVDPPPIIMKDGCPYAILDDIQLPIKGICEIKQAFDKTAIPQFFLNME